MTMKITIASVALMMVAACGNPAETDDNAAIEIPQLTAAFTGDWAGPLVLPNGAELTVVLHVREGAGTGRYDISLDSPDQGAYGIVGENGRVEEDMLLAEIPSVNVSFSLKAEEGTLTGTFTQGLPLPITLMPYVDTGPPARPQEPTERPYVIEEVSFPGGADGVTLSGELTYPETGAQFPALVMISGSGPQDRNEELMGHKPFLVLSDHLTRAGYAVLRYDDRGVGESTGDYAAATSGDFADDAAAALLWLRAQPMVQEKPSGYLGHSEGGLIAPLATKTERPDFMVLLAGMTESLSATIIRQSRDMGAASGTPEATLDLQARQFVEIFDIMRTAETPDDAKSDLEIYLKSQGLPDAAIEAQVGMYASPWMMWGADVDPTPLLAAYGGPVLSLYGALDMQVDAEINAGHSVGAQTNSASEVLILDGLNHLFQPGETGLPAEYGKIETTFDQGAMDEISGWLDGVTE